MKYIYLILAALAIVALAGAADAAAFWNGQYSSIYYNNPSDFGMITWNPTSGMIKAYTYSPAVTYSSCWGYVSPWGW